MIKDAVLSSANHWFTRTCNQKSPNPLILVTPQELEENKLQHIIECLQLVQGYVHRSNEFYDKIFLEYINIRYTGILYEAFELKLADVIKYNIEDVCSHLEKIQFDPMIDIEVFNENTQVTMTTTIFEIYNLVQTFLTMGRAVAPENSNNFKLNEFYLWFENGISYWIGLATLKIFILISKIIETDKLKAMDDIQSFSDGSIIILKMFYEMKEFWEVLEWPILDKVGLKMVVKLIHNICSCFMFYCDKLVKKKNQLIENVISDAEALQAVDIVCTVINNIEHLYSKTIGMIKTISQKDTISGYVLQTITNVLDFRIPQLSGLTQAKVNSLLFDIVAINVDRSIHSLTQVISSIDSYSQVIDQVINFQHSFKKIIISKLKYNETNIEMVYVQLQEQFYKRFVNIVSLAESEIENILEKNSKQPLSYFQNSHSIGKLLLQHWSYKIGSEFEIFHKYNRILENLELCGMETASLIYRNCRDCQQSQDGMESAPFGKLTISAEIKDKVLNVSVK